MDHDDLPTPVISIADYINTISLPSTEYEESNLDIIPTETNDIKEDPSIMMLAREMEITIRPKEQLAFEKNEPDEPRTPAESNRARKRWLWVSKIVKKT